LTDFVLGVPALILGSYVLQPFLTLKVVFLHSFVFFLNMFGQHRDIYLPLPGQHPIEFGQTIIVMLHHSKINSIVIY